MDTSIDEMLQSSRVARHNTKLTYDALIRADKEGYIAEQLQMFVAYTDNIAEQKNAFGFGQSNWTFVSKRPRHIVLT